MPWRLSRLATQRVTIAKIGGLAAEVVIQRLRAWSEARTVLDEQEWSSDQWPRDVRSQADHFVDRLRANSLAPPVVHFVEWSDWWSMFDVYRHWLTPSDGPLPLYVQTDRMELYGYRLPDNGRLEAHLAAAGPQQFPEYDQLVTRLQEAVDAWGKLVEQSALILVRTVVGGLVTDDELLASLPIVPDWLAQS